MFNVCKYIRKRKKAKELEELRKLALNGTNNLVHQPSDLENLLVYLVKVKAEPDFKLKVLARCPLSSHEEILESLSSVAELVLTKKLVWGGISKEIETERYSNDHTPLRVWADLWFGNYRTDTRLVDLLKNVKQINNVLLLNNIRPNDVYRSLFEKGTDKNIDRLVNGYVAVSSELFTCFKEIYAGYLK